MQVTHHVVIDERAENNLKIVAHEDYIKDGDSVEVCNGSFEYCEDFHKRYSEEVPYPIVDMEEEY